MELHKRLGELTGVSEEICYEYLVKYNFDLNTTFENLIKSESIDFISGDIGSSVCISNKMKDKRIGIFATMSAGKSTLINALVGYNLCPSQNQACTAKILKFTNNDELEHPIYINETEQSFVTLGSLRQLNQTSDKTMLEFELNFKGIQNKNQKIHLFDTPGVNYSQDLSHGELSYHFLSSQEFDQIIYLMNATQFGVDDDKALLMELKQKLKNQKTDLIFLINKIDEFDIENDESIQTIVHSCFDYLEEIGFENPKIIPISGQAAKLIRMALMGEEMSRKERMDVDLFIEIFSHSAYYLPQYRKNLSYESETNRRLYGSLTIGTKTYPLKEVMQALDATGILMLEQLISQ